MSRIAERELFLPPFARVEPDLLEVGEIVVEGVLGVLLGVDDGLGGMAEDLVVLLVTEVDESLLVEEVFMFEELETDLVDDDEALLAACD